MGPLQTDTSHKESDHTVKSSKVRTPTPLAGDSVFSGLKTPTQILGNIFLGEKLADGVVASFGGGKPTIHVLDTDARATLQSIRNHAAELPNCIERYRVLQGFTPSKEAFKVCELILRKHMGGDREAIATLKKISDEATRIDLRQPADSSWKREMCCSIGGVTTRITISVMPVSLVTRLVTRVLSTDLSPEARANRYGFQVTLRPEAESSKLSLAPMRRLCRQVAEMSLKIAPMLAVGASLSDRALVDVASNLTRNQSLQSLLADGLRFASYAAVGAVTFIVTQRMQRARLCPTEKPLSST